MKKIKLLMPVLSVGLLAPTATLLVGCGNNKDEGANVVLDTTECSAEQTTDANITINTYVFNVKNFDSSKETITAEIPQESISTSDDVVVEITETKYVESEKKFYVLVSTSKLAGDLNDQETVKFSIKFTCTNNETQQVKWTKTIDSLAIKHVDGETTAHFVSKDVNKLVKTNDKTLTSAKFTFPATDAWTNSTVEGKLNIANLEVYAFQGHVSRLAPILVKDAKFEFNSDYSEITVTVNFEIDEFAERATTMFNLAFVYGTPEMAVKDCWVQNIGGFVITYDQDYTDNHTWLASSREKWYYKTVSTDNETAYNYIPLIVDYDYDLSKITVSSNNSKVKLGTDFIKYNLTSGFYGLAIPYTIDDIKEEWPFPGGNIFNVSITVKSSEAENEWEETHYGLSFMPRYAKWPLISAASDFPTELVIGDNSLVDKFDVVTPYDISDLVAYSAKCDSAKLEMTINEFNWEKTDVTITVPEGTTPGTYDITYNILLVNELASYMYQLKVSTTIK